MSRLAEQQRALLALIKNKPVGECKDEWVMRISHSRELAMMRDVARWWRRYQVSAQCRFTSRLLKRSGSFEAEVNGYFEAGVTSPFIEEMGRGFLARIATERDGLVQAIALTELGLLGAKGGMQTAVMWDRNPDLVFAALEQGSDLPETDKEFDYRLTIGPDLSCVKVQRSDSFIN